MTDSWGPTAANAALDATGTAYPWIQKHVGAPGAAGTANVAGDTTRKQAAWASASAGSKASSADLNWTNVSTAEQYTHWSSWSLATGGTFGVSGAITGNAVAVGDNFTIAAGTITMSVPLAS